MTGSIFKNNKIAGISVAIVSAFIAYFAVNAFLIEPLLVKNQLKKVAGEINMLSPIMVDAETRLDQAVVLPNKTFQYNYTLVYQSVEEMDTAVVAKNLKPTILKNIQTSPDLKPFREKLVTLNYSYKDQNDVPVLFLQFTPKEYLEIN